MSDTSNSPVAYELHVDPMDDLPYEIPYEIRRVESETFGRFATRDKAREHMIATEDQRAARDAATGAVTMALLSVERAARELDALFDGEPGNWRLDGVWVADDASQALLSLHDYLNDVDAARGGDDRG